MTKLKAARATHPGCLIVREVNARGWKSEADWATCPLLPEIALGDMPITEELAHQLAEVFGTSVQFWLNLQANYDEAIGDD